MHLYTDPAGHKKCITEQFQIILYAVCFGPVWSSAFKRLDPKRVCNRVPLKGSVVKKRKLMTQNLFLVVRYLKEVQSTPVYIADTLGTASLCPQ